MVGCLFGNYARTKVGVSQKARPHTKRSRLTIASANLFADRDEIGPRYQRAEPMCIDSSCIGGCCDGNAIARCT